MSDDKKSDARRKVPLHERRPMQQMVYEHNSGPSSEWIQRAQPRTDSRIRERESLRRLLESIPAYDDEYGRDIRLPAEPKKKR